MGIISDFCIAYRTEIKSQINIEVINEMINNLKSQINKNEYDRFIKIVEYVISIIFLKYKLYFRESRMQLNEKRIQTSMK